MERDVREYAVPYMSQSRMAARWHSGVMALAMTSSPHHIQCGPRVQRSGGYQPPHGPNASRHQCSITATSQQMPRPKIWWHRPPVTRARPAERTCTATRRPRRPPRSSRTQKAFHMLHIPLFPTFFYRLLPLVPYHLILSANSTPLTLLLLPSHVSLHLRRWSIVCLEEGRVSFSSPADVWQLPAYWHVSYSQRPLFVSLPV